MRAVDGSEGAFNIAVGVVGSDGDGARVAAVVAIAALVPLASLLVSPTPSSHGDAMSLTAGAGDDAWAEKASVMLRRFKVACCTSQLLGDAHSMRLHETGSGARDDSEGVAVAVTGGLGEEGGGGVGD
jgi:hypothetical protein